MSAVVPGYFDFPLAADTQSIAPARVINQRAEAGQHPVERVNQLYAGTCRPHVWAMRYVTPLQQPSASYVWSPYLKVKLGADRDAYTIYGWGEYADVEVILYDTSKVQDATTGALTVGATPAALLGTWSGVTVSEGYIRYRWRENPATPGSVGKLYELKILPDALAAGDLPA